MGVYRWIPAFAGTTASVSFLRRQESSKLKLKYKQLRPRMAKQPAIYLLASKRNGTLYIGVTSNLVQRIWQHRNDLVPGFTQRYKVHRLVYYELHDEMTEAISREKQLKKWKRDWKLKLIEGFNPDWRDLWWEIVE